MEYRDPEPCPEGCEMCAAFRAAFGDITDDVDE
jgi:hypothetical protein